MAVMILCTLTVVTVGLGRAEGPRNMESRGCHARDFWQVQAHWSFDGHLHFSPTLILLLQLLATIQGCMKLYLAASQAGGSICSVPLKSLDLEVGTALQIHLISAPNF